MSLKITTSVGIDHGDFWLDEATKEACVDLGSYVNRTPLTDIRFEQLRREGDWKVKHADGRFRPARRNRRSPRGDPGGAAG